MDDQTRMMTGGAVGDGSLSVTELACVVEVCDRFEGAWRTGRGPRIEEYLGEVGGVSRWVLLRELVGLEVELRTVRGETPSPSEYCVRFPEYTDALRALLEHRSQTLIVRDRTAPGRGLLANDLEVWVNQRYKLLGLIGCGGMGVVYRAYDRRLDKTIAVKTLKWFDPALLYRFKHEFRALSNVSHPNLVTLYELTSDNGTWFIAMEYVDGVPFTLYISRDVDPSAKPGDARWLNRLRSALVQLALGVCALHDAGKLHRDIKPSNVLVTREGRVVVLDFGLAAELGAMGVHDSTEGRVVGTASYMAPEQAGGQSTSPASDWYSVGTMLYESLTGRLPFAGSGLDVLIAKRQAEPPPPGAVVAELPDDLASLCADLLRREPSARPTGREILRRLGAVSCDAEAPRAAGLGRVPLVGRGRHLEALESGFSAVARGGTVLTLVHGQSGVGKSALVAEFLDGLRGRGEVLAYTGRCYEQESVPYKALDMIIDGLSRHLKRLPVAEARALVPRDVLLLAQVFPVLLQSEAVATAPRRALEIPDPQELRRRAFAVLRELVARIGDRSPLVLCVDDLQWGDVDSAQALADLLRPPEPPALLFVGCYRDDDPRSSPFLRELFGWREQTATALDWRDLHVETLSRDESADLACRLLGRDDRVAARQAEVIARESGGSPLYIAELVRSMTTEVDPSGEAAAACSVSLDEVLWGRVARLPAPARQLLEVVAVAGRPLVLDDACAAAGLGAGSQEAQTLLRSARLLRRTGLGPVEQVEVYHDRVGEAVRAHLTAEAVAGHHRGLATALESAGRREPEVLAAHYLGAGQLARAGELYTLAARQAAEALAFGRAVDLYRLSIKLREDDGEAMRQLRVAMGDALVNANRGVEAAREYLRATPGAPDDEATDLERRAAMQLLISGHIDEGLALLRKVLGTVDLWLPATPRMALTSLLFHRAWLQLRGMGFRQRDPARVPVRELNKIDVSWSGVVGLSITDWIRGADFQTRNLLLSLRAGEPSRIARSLATEGAHNATGGHAARRRTARLLGVAEALAGQVGSPYAHGMVALSKGLAAHLEGRWRSATEAFDDAERVFRDHCTGVAWEIDTTHTWSLWSLTYMGRLAELARRLPVLLDEAHQRGDRYAITNLSTYVSAMVHLADDDPGGAARESELAMRHWSHQGFHVQHHIAVLSELYTLLYRGEPLGAWDRITALWPSYRSSLLLRVRQTWIDMHQLRARVALLAASADPARVDLLRQAQADAARLEADQTPWAQAHACSIRASLALARRDTAAASALLSETASLFDSVDMELHSAAARYRLGEIVVGSPGREITDQAVRRMAAQNVVRPDRFAAMLSPGFFLDD